MKAAPFLLTVGLSVLLSVGAVFSCLPISKDYAAPKETAFAHIARTSTIRCGYVLFANFTMKDPNTKALSGIYYDLLEEVGRQMNLKIEWTEEVGTGNIAEGVNLGRYDVICAPLSATGTRARIVAFTDPVGYLFTRAYVRADDFRFDGNLEKINDPSIKVSFVDGELGQIIKEQRFQRATGVSLPNLTDYSQDILDVVAGKADTTFIDTSLVALFEKSNPGKIRPVDAPPLYLQPVGLSVAVGEEELKTMLNTTLSLLQNNGFVEVLFEKYLGPYGQNFYLPAPSWRRPGLPVNQ